MYGTLQKIPSGGEPETLYTQQSVVCMEEKTSQCVCCTYPKQSLYDTKEIQEKTYGKEHKVFCL